MDFHEAIAQYKELHSTRHYGSSAMLFFKPISRIILKENPKSILDFGCGRSDLATYFWRDGERRIEKFDPAIPEYKSMPEGKFECVICTDVMEHIPEEAVDFVLNDIDQKLADGGIAIFTISTKPARTKLPNGQNAHCTLWDKVQWVRRLQSRISNTIRIHDSGYEHQLLIVVRKDEK